MGMSPSRMPQTQGMVGSHPNNMVAQPANQSQFLPQGQFPAAAAGAVNVNVSLGQPITQPAVTQVRILYAFTIYIAPWIFLFKHGQMSVTELVAMDYVDITVHPSLSNSHRTLTFL